MLLSSMFSLPSFDFLSEQAMTADQLGFNSVWVPDHLYSSEAWTTHYGGNINNLGLLDPWSTLAAFATITNRVNLGTLVTPMTLRSPGLLAKIATAVDIISKGRLILGLGAGWNEDEFNSFGIPWDNFKIRIRKLDEGVTLIKKLWSESNPIDFNGRYYKMKRAHFWPKPMSKPYPPIYFGGSSNAILKLVGKTGDGWVPYQPTSDFFREKMEKIKQYCEKFNRQVNNIVGGAIFQCVISDTFNVAQRQAESLAWPNKRLKETAFIGSSRTCIQKIDEYIDVGVKEFIFVLPLKKIAKEQLKQISKEIISCY